MANKADFHPYGIVFSAPSGEVVLNAGPGIRIFPQGNLVTISTTTSSSSSSATTGNITGLISAGTNVTITGSGTSLSPYVINASGGGGGTPGGTNGQVQYNNAGSFGGFFVGGDGTLNATTGVLVVTKTAGVAFAASATTNTTTTANITDSTNKRFVTDAELVILGNTSGTNTGDVTLGTANGLSLAGQVLSLGLASTSTTGALTSTDWNTFNGKQPSGSYVTSIGVTTANGVSATSSGGTTPSLTFTLGAITPASVAATGQISTISTSPAILFQNTAAGTDSKNWVVGASSTIFQGYALNDAGTVSAPWLNVTRSGATIASIALITGSNTTALTLDSSQKATFAGHLVVEGVTSTGATGTGKFVFDTNASLITPNIGTPSAATLTNATGLPLASGTTGVLPETKGGTNQSTYTLGDTLYASAANTLAKLSGNTTTAKQYLSQTGTGSVSAAPAWAAISGSDITGAALTETDDTNVTMTLGGTPATALLRAVSMTLGWTGILSGTRGGTGVNNGANKITLDGNLHTAGAFNMVITATANTSVTLPTTGTLATLAGTETLTNKTGTSSTNTWFNLTTTGSGAATYTGNTLNIPTPAASGTVTSVSVVSTNGFAGTVATATTTPAITISTTITGLLKGNGTAVSAATAGTDYQVPITLTTTGTSGAATFSGGTLNIPDYANTTYSAGTGLTLTGTTFSVNTSQNIATLSNLTTNGFVKTTGGAGTLSIDTNTYLTANQSITLSGIVTGSGTTAITTSFGSFSSATLAAALTDETGSGAAVFGTNPAISGATITGGTINNTPIGATTANTGKFTTITGSSLVGSAADGAIPITGTNTNDSAATGIVGEYISASLAAGSAVSLTNSVAKTVISISLTAGDWDVAGEVDLIGATGAALSYCLPSVSLTTNTTGPFINATYAMGGMIVANYALNTSFQCTLTRVSLASTTTVYLIAQAGFLSTFTAFGSIRARRIR